MRDSWCGGKISTRLQSSPDSSDISPHGLVPWMLLGNRAGSGIRS